MREEPFALFSHRMNEGTGASVEAEAGNVCSYLLEAEEMEGEREFSRFFNMKGESLKQANFCIFGRANCSPKSAVWCLFLSFRVCFEHWCGEILRQMFMHFKLK